MDDLAEWAASELFQEAGADPASAVGAIEIAQGVLGADCFRYLPVSSLAGGAALCRVRNRWFIYIAKTLTGHRLNHAVGHELGHLFCARLGHHPADEEQLADRIGGALCAPRAAFLAAHREHGIALKPLAKCFTVSLAGAALRLGETTSIPVALADSAQVRIRGNDWDWPEEEHLRAGLPVVGAKLRRVERGAVAYCVA